MTRAKIASYENGHTKNPSLKDLNILSEYFSISIDVLLKLGLATMPDYKLTLVEQNKFTGADLRVVVTTTTAENIERIEYVPWKAKAGYLTGYSDPDYISRLPTFDLPHLPKGKKYRMFPTQGDSMLPIPQDALIVGEYLEDWLSIKEGQLCVIVTETEGIVFKQIVKIIKEEAKLVLGSLNPHYNPFTVQLADVLEIWKHKCFISDFVPDNNEGTYRDVYGEIIDLKKDVKKILNIVDV
jgi:transcriptional regulator with XRE-family HTH domain